MSTSREDSIPTNYHDPNKYSNTRRFSERETGKIPRAKPPESVNIPSENLEAEEKLPKISSRINGIRGEVAAVSETKEILPPHYFELLHNAPESAEKERIIEEVYRLMQENHFKNVSAEDRFWKGCIYHIPHSVDGLKERIKKSKLFIAILRESDRKLLGFTEFTANRIKRSKSKIRHPVERRLKVVIEIPDQNVYHEQLIVADQTLKIKGIGTALLQEAFSRSFEAGVQMVTTEVQTVPPNNNSQHFHLSMGYSEIGIVNEHPPGEEPVSFVLYARPLTEEIASKFYTDTPNPDTE